MAQLVEQLTCNQQVVGSSPITSSKTCVNTAFSQVFSFSQMNFKIQYAIKNLTLFYGVRFLLFIRIFAQDHLLTIYELILFLQCFIDFVEYKSIGIIAIITKDVYAAFFEMFKDCRGDSAVGSYLNYLATEKSIFLPVFGVDTDND